MKILKYSVGQLQANCYLLIKENNCLIIDPGDEANFILEQLQRKKLNPVSLLATHGHFDHILAVGEIQQSFNIPLYISKKDQFLIDRLEETAEFFLGYSPATLPIKTIRYFKVEDSLKITNFKLEVISTPGHTPGGCSLYFPEEKIVFTGDTLFKQGIGRYDFSYCNKADLFDSVKKIRNLPIDTIIYSGHGETTTIKDELNVLNFFK